MTVEEYEKEVAIHNVTILFSDWMENEAYPLTVTRDRYNGAYSGGRLTAWLLDPEEVPKEINDNDGPCREFWTEENKQRCGIGNSFEEALLDLFFKRTIPAQDEETENEHT